MKRTLLIEIICGLLVLLFFYAAASKLKDLPAYYGAINAQPFPNVLTPFLVWGIPVAEISIAVAVMSERFRLAGLYCALILMGAFSLYIGLILVNTFGVIPCSCGGIINALGWREHLVFNLFFVIIAAIGIVLQKEYSWQRKTGLELSV